MLAGEADLRCEEKVLKESGFPEGNLGQLGLEAPGVHQGWSQSVVLGLSRLGPENSLFFLLWGGRERCGRHYLADDNAKNIRSIAQMSQSCAGVGNRKGCL